MSDESRRKLGALAWLIDVPAFIDAERVSDLYDAVIAPSGEAEEYTITFSEAQEKSWSVSGEMKADFGFGRLLELLGGPGATASATVGGERSGGTQEGASRSVKMKTIDTPSRQLIQLTAFYLAENEHLLVLEDYSAVRPEDSSGTPKKWTLDWYTQMGPPRPLLYIDLPPETAALLPMAVEVEKGKVVTVFKELQKAISTDDEDIPPLYPTDANDEGRRAYWSWFETHFNSYTVMECLEDSIRGAASGAPEWIDYRLRLPDDINLHLHLEGRGKFSTGTYAYKMIRRGWKHGLRIVGTLKAGPAIDVLAVFEK